jgi:hypothetical protein
MLLEGGVMDVICTKGVNGLCAIPDIAKAARS